MGAKRVAVYVLVICALFRCPAARSAEVPGVAIRYSPASSGIYLGSPGIAVLPNGRYVAKLDEFGPRSTEHGVAVTQVFESSDRGVSWSYLATVKGMYWATLFAHRGNLYLMGTTRYHGATVISRSEDGGQTWTRPKDKKSGLLLDDAKFHCAPVPVVVHKGRIWRAMEDAMGPDGWGGHFRAFMMSVPTDADLLDADNWTSSKRLGVDGQWLDGKFNGWLEGNAVATPEGHIVNILRVDYRLEGGKAAIIEISDDGKEATFDADRGFIDFPGGCKKFAIRYDPVSERYWTLSNAVLPRHQNENPERVRNALALASSSDLHDWTLRCIVLYHPDTTKHAFQYVDWLFDGDDMIVASRTAYGQGERAAFRQHDANYLTFHRIEGFRDLAMKDSAVGARPGEAAWRRQP
jgi:hypothetical protein